MPELPEVEVVKKSLEKQINNLTIKDVKIRDGNLRYKVKKQDINKIIGLKILKIKRRSKYLLFFLSQSFVMIVHFGMTGKFFIIRKNRTKQKTSFYYNIKENENNKHDRLTFFFNNNLKLVYNDVRKFGFIKVDLVKEIDENSHLKLLGPEPLSNFFNSNYFNQYLIGKKRIIKNLLMDQKFVSGLGNIYVNEILFLSKIKPNRKIEKLRETDIKNILKNTKYVLKKAILLGGSSIKDFAYSSGEKGNFQQHFKVYGRKGLNCSNKNCNGIIKKIEISSRASFFCHNCQK
tara:strand:+ start:4061 stop:4930 length:870 start_codon:yes stop_codon:yes gene_type:complete